MLGQHTVDHSRDDGLSACDCLYPISSGNAPVRTSRYAAISFARTTSGLRDASAAKRTTGKPARRATVDLTSSAVLVRRRTVGSSLRHEDPSP
jgi:hypothetical protein